MKFAIPEISWHNRDPVLSADFQPKSDENGPLRLATGGTDSHVLIWYISTTEAGTVNLEVAADLTRHQKAVNIVRWSPNGQLLASGDDESIIFIWKQKFEKELTSNLDQTDEQYKESWVVHKTLRGHMEDVLDLSWSADSLYIASGSVDNKLLIWDVTRGRYSCILSDHKGFVQGVCWDPKGQLIVTASTDRTFRTFDVTTKKVISRSSKAILPFPAGHALHNTSVRLYHDDTLQTFYRRLQFSPDGLFVAVPAGRIEPEHGKMDGKLINAVYIYTRYSLKVPACVVPCGEPALVVRWSPRRYAARREGPAAALAGAGAGGARMVLAVGTRRSVLLYDTQQKTPLALISNIHYTRLTDLTWAADGRRLVAASTDGFCSVITFAAGELGDALPDHAAESTEDRPSETPKEQPPGVNILTPKQKQQEIKPKVNVLTPKQKPQDSKSKEKQESKSTTPKLDSFITFKAPAKSPKKDSKKQNTEPPKTPIKIDVLNEVAMPSWSDDSSETIRHAHAQPMEEDTIRRAHAQPMEVDDPQVLIIEDSEDIQLVYEESQGPRGAEPAEPPADTSSNVSGASENTFLKSAKVTDVKETAPSEAKPAPSPRAPRRVNFVTLSSPKNKKKL